MIIRDIKIRKSEKFFKETFIGLVSKPDYVYCFKTKSAFQSLQ